MDKRKIGETLLWGILLPSGILIGIFIWTVRNMGDRSCDIEIKNIRNERLLIKTFLFTRYDSKLTIDSIQLEPSQKMKIGHCIDCSKIDSTNIDFVVIGILTRNSGFRILKGRELIDYLKTKDKVGCATYLIE